MHQPRVWARSNIGDCTRIRRVRPCASVTRSTPTCNYWYQVIRVCKRTSFHLPVYSTHPTPRIHAQGTDVTVMLLSHIRNSISHTVGRSHDRARRDTVHTYTGRQRPASSNFSTLYSVPRGVLCSSDTMTVATTRSHTRRAGTLLGRNPRSQRTHKGHPYIADGLPAATRLHVQENPSSTLAAYVR